MNALAVIAALAVIILFHETGHFLFAKLAGLPVERFSIGFPPHILKFRAGATQYCIGAIPLGGYVKVDLGTSGESRPASHWALRLLAAAAGPAANFLLAVILLFSVLAITGQEAAVFSNVVGPGTNSLGLSAGDTILAVNGVLTPDFSSAAMAIQDAPAGTILAGTPGGRREIDFSLAVNDVPGFEPLIPPVVGECIVGMPAYEAGLRMGDSLVTVDGDPVRSWTDLLESVRSAPDREITIEYLRDGGPGSARLRPMMVDGAPRIGVVARTATMEILYPPGQAALYAVSAAAGGVAGFFGSLASAFSRPRDFVDMSGGPLYMAEALGQQAGFGLGRLLEAVAGISIAIMCFNLLPIPLLDGGHILFLLYEGIARRPMSRRAILIAQQVGLSLIFLLMVLIMWKDLSRIFLRARS